ncbi:MAG: ribonuclease R [Phycisphaerae bacterium]
MPQRYAEAIMKYLADRQYQPLKPRQLARVMGVAEEDYGTFRLAVKQLRDSGRIIMGAKDALMLPELPGKVTGFYRPNPRGFGFVVPQSPNAHGDLYIPAGEQGGAIAGDLVVARVTSRGKRDGRSVYTGRIVEVLQRGQNRYVGTLQHARGAWFVMPDGAQMTTPIVVRDIGTAGPKPGSKVVAEIVQYGRVPGELPTGVIVERLGEQGELAVETLAVIRAHGLEDQFSEKAMADARASIAAFDGRAMDGRVDLTGQTIITIDPPDARDFDDAISLRANRDGTSELGVHIADVSHFVREGTALDEESRRRSTSVYFPRRVVPMLPEVLSNGVCSLQEGQRRYCLSAFITYDREGNVRSTRFARSVISSVKRLTYTQAQGIIDGQTGGYERAVVELLRAMNDLSRRIEQRRRKAGMIHLDLPEVELVFDDNDKVIDAVQQDTSYTHTMIEMFMVEANEAVARLLDKLDRPFLRRIHPEPDQIGGKQLSSFVRACGHRLPVPATPRDIQDMLDAVRGRPESYAVNLAVLKTFEQAEYSPMRVGHFALGSRCYCHFTSPIRRYPDLTVHRLLAEHCRGELAGRPPEDMSALTRLGEHCSAAERRAKAAEDELREVLILQFLSTKVGEEFDGVVTGVTNFGLFVQSPRFLIDGLLRLEDLGDDWWNVDARLGAIRGQSSGRKMRIGDIVRVQIAGVDIARRQLNLVLARGTQQQRRPERQKPQQEQHRQQAQQVHQAPDLGGRQHGRKGQRHNRRRRH